ncbi:MAG: class I SAM-dependent methyltransferase [Actinomycetota bacterium]|nr:class I SAM-dependent methyltransferase [Actinomycetota bacterium]
MSLAAPDVVLRTDTGEALDLDLRRWHDPATAEEREVLASVTGPVIDLGCGPGRLVVSLASRGVPTLGVDSSPAAVALARLKGATVLERDIFGPLPGEGRWATALLFDGNVGIGGDPARLLRRCRALTRTTGQVVAEVEPPGRGWRRVTARLERNGRRSDPFAWAVVGADAIAELAHAAGLRLASLVETASGRRFARLETAAP